MTFFLEILFLLVFAAVKFVFAAGYLIVDKGFPYPQTVLILFCGGTLGVVVFYYFSSWVNQFINRLIKPNKPRKLFTKKNRNIVKIKVKYGVYGIAFLSPVLISIPIGCFFASRFFLNKKSTIFILIGGVLFWSLTLPLIKLYF